MCMSRTMLRYMLRNVDGCWWRVIDVDSCWWMVARMVYDVLLGLMVFLTIVSRSVGVRMLDIPLRPSSRRGSRLHWAWVDVGFEIRLLWTNQTWIDLDRPGPKNWTPSCHTQQLPSRAPLGAFSSNSRLAAANWYSFSCKVERIKAAIDMKNTWPNGCGWQNSHPVSPYTVHDVVCHCSTAPLGSILLHSDLALVICASILTIPIWFQWFIHVFQRFE